MTETRLGVRFFVPGQPRPGGSKRAFYNPVLKRSMITEDCKKTKDWRTSVGFKAAELIKVPFDTAVQVEFVFCLQRPKGHYGSGRNSGRVRGSAPRWPAVKPDVTKLIRSTEDALTKIAWRDDSQVVLQIARKIYVEGHQAGAWITIREMEAVRDEDHGSQGEGEKDTQLSRGTHFEP
jgi:Holliday junction resolvase RusA-like endonuclease